MAIRCHSLNARRLNILAQYNINTSQTKSYIETLCARKQRD